MTEVAEQRTLADVLSAVIAERGGEQCFDASQRLIVRGFVRAAALVNEGDTSKLGAMASLAELLPPKVGDSRGSYVDMARLTDEDLDRLIDMHDRAGCEVAPEPGSLAEQLNEALGWNEELNALVARKADLLRIAEAEIEIHRQLAATAQAENEALRGRLQEAIEALRVGYQRGGSENASLADPSLGPGSAPGRPSNVVPFIGNGSAAISTPLEDRYPSGLPPVGRW